MITYADKISVDDYNALRVSVGWEEVHPEQAAAGLQNSVVVIAAMDGTRTVGTARLIWDGGYTALVCDVLVLPEYQLKGIGAAMMTRLEDYLRSRLKPGYRITMYLVVAKGKEGFYEKLGFITRPSETRGPGMQKELRLENKV